MRFLPPLLLIFCRSSSCSLPHPYPPPLSTGLRPIPPLFLGCRPEASRGPLGPSEGVNGSEKLSGKRTGN
eukprot:577438-Pyramimonas_sp.AAC.1